MRQNRTGRKSFLVLLSLLLVFMSVPLTVVADSSGGTVVWSLDTDRLGVPGLTANKEYLEGEDGAYQPGVQLADQSSSYMQMYAGGALGIHATEGAYKAINIQTGDAVGGTNHYWNEVQGFKAAADTTYTVTFSVYVADGTGQVRVRGNSATDGTWETTEIGETPKSVSYTWTQAANGGNLQIDTGSTAKDTIVYIMDLQIKLIKSAEEPTVPVDPNIVLSHGFEDGELGGWYDLGWNGNGTVAVTSDEASEGSKSLVYTDRSNRASSPALNLTSLLKVGHSYDISFKVKVGAGTDSYHLASKVESPNLDNNYPWLIGNQTVSADEWTLFELKGYEVPEGTSEFIIWVEADDKDNADKPITDLYIDGVMIIDVTPPTENIIMSHGFEDGDLGGWYDLGWNGNGTVAVTSDEASEGSKSLKYSDRSNRASSPALNLTSLLKAGHTYDISFKVKIGDGTDSYHLASKVDSPKLDNQYPWLIGNQTVSDDSWTLFELKGYEVPEDTAEFIIWVEADDKDNAGKPITDIYIDEVLIIEYAPDGTEEPAKPRDPALPFTMITFEDGELGGFVARAGTETLVVTDEANHTPGGNYALKVEGRSDTWHGPSLRVEQYIDLGYEYKISAWVKLISPANSQLQLSTQIGDGGNASYNNVQGKTIRTEDGWVLLEGTYRYNSVGDEYVTIYVESSADANASFYIDDISFEATGSGPVDIERDLVPIKDVYKDYFLIGNAFSAKDLEGVRLELLKMHHNVLTAENAMKPGESYSKEPGKERDFDFTDEIALVDKAIAEGFQIVGHTLVWHQQSPEWLWQDSNGDPLSREVALANMRTHIEAAVESVGDKVIAWDVVNEAIDDGLANIDPTDWQGSLRKSGWYNAIGPDYVKEAFLATREVLDDNGWSDVKLYYNDYNDDNQNKATAIYHMVKAINDEYAADNGGRLLIDGIGMQGHYNINVNPNNVERSIERFSSLGVEISITELDITDNMDNNLTEEEAAAQAQLYAQLFQIFKKHKDSIARITFWGLDDASSWRSEGFPLLFDGNLQAKNNYFAVIDPDKYLEDNAPVLPEANHSFANYGTPAIDGKEDPEIWARSPELPINQYQMAWQGATGTARVLWDEDNLYVLVKVTDDQLDNESADAYQQDSVEVFLDEDNAKTSFYQDDDGQYRVNYLNETSFNPASIAAGFESETVVEGTNYTVEMKIPFKKITPAIGHKIGFDVQINDAKGNTRESIANWNDVTGVGYQDTSVFGVLTLIDGMIPPVNLSASAQGSNSIKVDWDFIGQESVTFAVYRATTSSGPFTVVAQDLEETEYIDKGLRSSTTYYYHVVANSAVESSIPSETVWAKTATAPRFDDTPAPTAPEPDIAPNEDGEVIVKPTVTTENGRAKASLSSDNLQQALEQAAVDESGQKKLVIEIEAQEGTDAVDVELPKASLASEEVYVVSLKTPQGTIDVPSNMLDGLDVDAETVTIAVAKADFEGLDEDVRSQIGNRPAISLNVLADGEVVAWNNPQAPVTVAIPYEPTEEELANPDHIIVWYIDGEGNAVAVPNGRYDADSGTVVFRTTHFSTYAINYVVKSFTDLAGAPWAKAAIEAMASRDVIAGVSATSFDPTANIKRADFVALLVRALELQDTGEATAMFDDVKETDYFYNEVKIAKQLGIASGTGNNEFNPNGMISRQDMMVLADLALQAAGKALQAQEDALDSFPDADDVANYAKASAAKLVANGIVSGTDGKLAPLDQLTRAQAAVILYQLWSK